jgi:hypothetical protein
MNRGSIPGRGKRYSLLYNAETDSGTHPVSYAKDTGDSFLGGKADGT